MSIVRTLTYCTVRNFNLVKIYGEAVTSAKARQ